MPGTFSPPPLVSDPVMHHDTCVTHMPWCMPGSLTSGFLWIRWWEKHSRRMRNPQFYVSGKRPIVHCLWYHRCYCCSIFMPREDWTNLIWLRNSNGHKHYRIDPTYANLTFTTYLNNQWLAQDEFDDSHLRAFPDNSHLRAYWLNLYCCLPKFIFITFPKLYLNIDSNRIVLDKMRLPP